MVTGFSVLDGQLKAFELFENGIENADLIQLILDGDMTDEYECAFIAELAVEACNRGLTDILVKACEEKDR